MNWVELSIQYVHILVCLYIWKDEIRARRNQEVADREWRRKEKDMGTKKAQEEAMLRAARVEQVHCKEHFLSIEAGREKAEFERVLK